MILSCGIVPIRFNKEGNPEFLLLRNYHHWDFPKGCMEDGESELETAVREFREESGLKKVEFEWGEECYSTEPYSKPKKIARYFVGRVDPDEEVVIRPNPETGRMEHQEFRWCLKHEATELLKPRIFKALDFAVGVIKDLQDKSQLQKPVSQTDRSEHDKEPIDSKT